MREGQSAVTRRLDYAPPAFWIDSVELTFDLDPAKTRVLNKMTLRRNPDVAAQPLRLDGDELNLSRVMLAGQACSFRMDGQTLVLENLPEGTAAFELEIFTTCYPEKNSKLMGLFLSGGDFFTQCEAEGFRHITWYPDRPDVMAPFRVTLRGDQPVLLSNGNPVASGEGWAEWHDPWPKPSYLFALVAGDLVARSDNFTTMGGRKVELNVWERV